MKYKKLAEVGFLLVLTTLLSGCKYAMLDPKGVIAASEKQIMLTATLLMLMVVIPVIVLTLCFAWRYRASNKKAIYKPEWQHSTLLEVIWWTIPCIIILILGTITWFTSHSLDPYKPLTNDKNKTITIQAIALNWKWLFIYPEQHIAAVNFIQIPVDTPIKFLITAEGPMNALQIPQLAGQIYAMAGMQSQLNIQANALGDYRGISANFSGDGFSDMKFTVRVSSATQFAQWVTDVQKSPKKLTMQAYKELAKPSINNPVAYFSSADSNIFSTIIMQAMDPMTNKVQHVGNEHAQ